MVDVIGVGNAHGFPEHRDYHALGRRWNLVETRKNELTVLLLKVLPMYPLGGVIIATAANGSGIDSLSHFRLCFVFYT